jgi:hypothetical protein
MVPMLLLLVTVADAVEAWTSGTAGDAAAAAVMVAVREFWRRLQRKADDVGVTRLLHELLLLLLLLSLQTQVGTREGMSGMQTKACVRQGY